MHRAARTAMLALALAACGEQTAPAAGQAAQALSAARADMEKARTAIEASDRHSKALAEKIRAQREQLDALIARRLELLGRQLEQDERLVGRLPAPRETELRPRLAELRGLLDEVKARLAAYRDAPPEKSAEALAALEGVLETLAERRRDLHAQLQPG